MMIYIKYFSALKDKGLKYFDEYYEHQRVINVNSPLKGLVSYFCFNTYLIYDPSLHNESHDGKIQYGVNSTIG